MRWPRFVGQLGGQVKAYSGCRSCRRNSLDLPVAAVAPVGKARSGSTGVSPRQAHARAPVYRHLEDAACGALAYPSRRTAILALPHVVPAHPLDRRDQGGCTLGAPRTTTSRSSAAGRTRYVLKKVWISLAATDMSTTGLPSGNWRTSRLRPKLPIRMTLPHDNSDNLDSYCSWIARSRALTTFAALPAARPKKTSIWFAPSPPPARSERLRMAMKGTSLA